MDSDRIKNTKRNIVAGVMFRAANILFPFIVNTIVIYTLGVEYLGLNSIFASILQVLTLTELGVGSAMVYSMYEPVAKGDDAKVSALLKLYRKAYLYIGAAVFALGLLSIPLLPVIVKKDVPQGLNIYILFLISLINCSISYLFCAYRGSLFTANQRRDIIDKLNMATDIGLNVFRIVLLLILKNYYVFCILQPIFTAVNCLLLYVVSRKKYPQYNCKGTVEKEEMTEIVNRVKGLFVNKVSSVICNSFDNIIISWFLGLTILGMYYNYFVVLNMLVIVLYIIFNSATPSIGNSIVCESVEKNYQDFNVFQLGFSWISGWCVTCLLCLYQPFMKLWVGERLMFDNVTVCFFAAYMYSLVMNAVPMAYREAAGIWANDKVRPLTEALVNLVLNIVLVKFVGLPGVLLSTILTVGLMRAVWGSYYLFKEYFTQYSHKRYLRRVLYYVLVTALVCVLSYWSVSFIKLEGIAELIVKGLVLIVLPNVLFLLCFIKSKYFKQLCSFVKSVIFTRK